MALYVSFLRYPLYDTCDYRIYLLWNAICWLNFMEFNLLIWTPDKEFSERSPWRRSSTSTRNVWATWSSLKFFQFACASDAATPSGKVQIYMYNVHILRWIIIILFSRFLKNGNIPTYFWFNFSSTDIQHDMIAHFKKS